MHFIDLRDVQTLGHAVQCNCAYMGQRTPGTPRNKDRSPMPGGGIMCCGDGSAGPVTAAAANGRASRILRETLPVVQKKSPLPWMIPGLSGPGSVVEIYYSYE